MGVPYSPGFDKEANKNLVQQSETIAASLKKDGVESLPNKEIVALIAYLQRLGTDIKGNTKK